MAASPEPTILPDSSPEPVARQLTDKAPSFGQIFLYVYLTVFLISLAIYIAELVFLKVRSSNTLPRTQPRPTNNANVNASTTARPTRPAPRAPRSSLPAVPRPHLNSVACATPAQVDTPLLSIPGLVTRATPPDGAEALCMICLEPLAGRPVAAGECCHWIHLSCMLHWLSIRGEKLCMACRHPISVPEDVRNRITYETVPDGAGGSAVVYSISDRPPTPTPAARESAAVATVVAASPS